MSMGGYVIVPSKRFLGLMGLLDEAKKNNKRTWIEIITIMMGKGVSRKYAELIVVELKARGIIQPINEPHHPVIYEIDIKKLEETLSPLKEMIEVR
jgi:hypothetical protein